MKVVPRIVVTGSTGFIGSRLVTLLEPYYTVLCIDLRSVVIEDLVFDNIDAVIHLAGIADDSDKIPFSKYLEVNTKLTEELALRAKQEEVPHFIFISSVKVFDIGLYSDLSNVDHVDTSYYAHSKLLAERSLKQIYSEDESLTIVRPSMVFGPKCKGNILKLITMVHKRFPLPLGNIYNKRALIFVDNLIWNIESIIRSKFYGVINLCDKSDLSTTQLVEQINLSLNLTPRIFSIPSIFRLVIKIISSRVYFSLFESNMNIEFYHIDENLLSSNAKMCSLHESLKLTADWYLNNHE